MNDRATGKIQSRKTPAQRGIQESSFAPDHVGHRVIHNDGPQDHEHQHRAELHALCKRACDQARCDDREHQLIHHKRLRRDCGRVIGVGRSSYTPQKQVLQTTEEAVARSKREAIAEQTP